MYVHALLRISLYSCGRYVSVHFIFSCFKPGTGKRRQLLNCFSLHKGSRDSFNSGFRRTNRVLQNEPYIVSRVNNVECPGVKALVPIIISELSSNKHK